MAKPALVDCGAVKFSIWKMAHRDNQKNNNSQCKEKIKLHHSLLSYFARSCDLLSATFVKPSHSALFQMKVVPENCPLVQHHIVLWCSTIMYWLQMTDTLGFESSNWPLARGRLPRSTGTSTAGTLFSRLVRVRVISRTRTWCPTPPPAAPPTTNRVQARLRP
jgi:hypothetical protein